MCGGGPRERSYFQPRQQTLVVNRRGELCNSRCVRRAHLYVRRWSFSSSKRSDHIPSSACGRLRWVHVCVCVFPPIACLGAYIYIWCVTTICCHRIYPQCFMTYVHINLTCISSDELARPALMEDAGLK